jgi:hypothetical protein
MTNMSQGISGHRGVVRNPQTDRRLKSNRHLDSAKSAERTDVQQGGQGRVKNPDRDRRLKNNR